MNLNTDKLISTFIRDVQEDVKEDHPNNATEILKNLEDRLHDIADEYMAECLLSSRRRRPSKKNLLQSFSGIYSDVMSDHR